MEEIELEISLLDAILKKWESDIGPDFGGYRNHCYRVVHFCQKLHQCLEEDMKKIVIAAAFHDLGLWTAKTVDYLPPSIELAKKYLKKNGLEAWTDEILTMIDMHHKVTPY